jgi:Fe-S cluster assembly ATP-binding protein
MNMLSINNLHVSVADKPILKGLTLEVPAGEVHAVMGPNGAGKSTLGYSLSGRPGYEVTNGSASWNGQDLLGLDPAERAAKGVFLSFQYPMEIPGVPAMTFIRTALNAQKRARRGGGLGPRLPEAGQGGVYGAEDGLRHAEAAAERRLLRR